MNADDDLAIALAMDCKRRRERLKAHEDDMRVELPRTFAAARKEQGQLLRRLWQIIERVCGRWPDGVPTAPKDLSDAPDLTRPV